MLYSSLKLKVKAEAIISIRNNAHQVYSQHTFVGWQAISIRSLNNLSFSLRSFTKTVGHQYWAQNISTEIRKVQKCKRQVTWFLTDLVSAEMNVFFIYLDPMFPRYEVDWVWSSFDPSVETVRGKLEQLFSQLWVFTKEGGGSFSPFHFISDC